MGRVNDDKWLDEALNKAIHSDDTRPDFEKWKATHPEAVEMLTTGTPKTQRPPVIRRIIMNATLIKLAAAAVIVVAAVFGITQITSTHTDNPVIVGPSTYTLPDGSTVKLGPGARIRAVAQRSKRGFEHLCGQIDVTVTKGLGEFVVTTPYGDVKALGTQFKLDLIDGVAQNTQEKVQLLTVEVEEGKVQVSNAKGSSIVQAQQKLVVAADQQPYDFSQDSKLAPRLRERIGSMVNAFKAGDAAAWAANFNINYLFKLAKGQVQYDPNLFGGTKEDAERLGQITADIKSPEEMAKAFVGNVNITGPVKIDVQSVELNKAGDHARAVCVNRKGEGSMTVIRPQWHYFDNDWWQVDD
jgi:hypothetical protein